MKSDSIYQKRQQGSTLMEQNEQVKFWTGPSYPRVHVLPPNRLPSHFTRSAIKTLCPFPTFPLFSTFFAQCGVRLTPRHYSACRTLRLPWEEAGKKVTKWPIALQWDDLVWKPAKTNKRSNLARLYMYTNVMFIQPFVKVFEPCLLCTHVNISFPFESTFCNGLTKSYTRHQNGSKWGAQNGAKCWPIIRYQVYFVCASRKHAKW